jgi:hypothetical protein
VLKYIVAQLAPPRLGAVLRMRGVDDIGGGIVGKKPKYEKHGHIGALGRSWRRADEQAINVAASERVQPFDNLEMMSRRLVAEFSRELN